MVFTKDTFCLFQSPCSSSPCLNGGICIPNYKYNSYDCRCEQGFYGDYCEKGKYDITHVRVPPISYGATMVKSLCAARPCIYHMTCAISLRLIVPVEFSCEVLKLSGLVFHSIPFEIDLLELKMKRKYAK